MTPANVDISHLQFASAPPSISCAHCGEVQRFTATCTPLVHAGLVKAFVGKHRHCPRVAAG